MFRTILVPLDGSEFSEQALPVAMAIARRTGASVFLTQVSLPTTHTEMLSGGHSDLDRRERERKALERLAAELNSAGIPAEATLLEGPVLEALTEHAAGVGADLVVMATHGRGPLSRIVLGGVADPLVRRLKVPTLLVRPTESAPGHGRSAPARHLLVALDGTPEAEAVLPTAVELGEAMGARFTLLRVVAPVTMQVMHPVGVITPYLDSDLTENLLKNAAVYLDRVAAPLRGRALTVETRVAIHADPASAILTEAHALGCDLIAMKSHGRDGLGRLVFGSVTAEVVHDATAPVLTHVPATA